MYAFAARFKPERRRVDRDGLRRHLRQRLPEYMVPSELQVLDGLPTTDNGKIDRGKLREWLPSAGETAVPEGALEAPVDELEQSLADIWAEMLGLPRVGRDQDFFALGGDSLVAAQIVARAREALPEAAGLQYDELLRALLEQTTVASLAAAIREGPLAAPDGAAAGRPSPVLTLSDVETGSPRILVHDATGGLEAAEPLVRRLGQDRRLLGLTVADAAAYAQLPADALLDELAEEYAAALLEREPDGAHLIGYRFGGLLAAEIGIRLMEAGLRPRLTVIASAPVEWPIDDPVVVEQLLACELGIDLDALGLPALAPRAPARSAARTLARPAGATQLERWEAAGAADALAYLEVFRRSLAAAATVQPTLYAGDVTLLRPSGDAPQWTPPRERMTEFWSERCLGQLTVVDVPGDCFSCLAGAELAEMLSESEKAEVLA
jgi:pyochelin synthetase